jgi:hypothetical protein
MLRYRNAKLAHDVLTTSQQKRSIRQSRSIKVEEYYLAVSHKTCHNTHTVCKNQHDTHKG